MKTKKTGANTSGASNLDDVRRGLAKERAQYDAKKEAYEGLEVKLTGEFESGLDASLTDEERDVLLEGNVLDIAQMIDVKKKIFVNDKLDDEKAELEEFESALEQKEMQLQDLDAETSFRDTHPDLDTDGFVAFLRGKMAPDDKEALLEEAEGDRVKFLGLVAKKFLESTGASVKPDPNLPTDLSTVAGATGDIDAGDGFEDDVNTDYLSSVGL